MSDGHNLVMRRALVFVTTILGVVIAMLGIFAVHDALPAIEESVGPGTLELRWIVNVYLVSLGALMLAGGAMADRFGRKRMLVWGLVIFTAASAACGLSQTFDQLAAARGVQGLGAALLLPATLSNLAATFADKGRGAVLGFWSAASAAAVVYGPVLGSYLLEREDWSWLFFINVPIGLLALLLAASVKESRDRSLPGRIDLAGLIFGTTGLAFLSYALAEGNFRGWGDRFVVGALGIAAVFLLIFFFVETRRSRPMVSLRFSGHATFSASNAVAVAAFFALYGIGIHFTAYLRNVLGFIPDQAAIRILPFAAALVLVSPFAGWLSDRAGSRGLMTWGCVLAAAALGLMLRVGIEPSYRNDLLSALALLGFGMALIVGPMTTTATAVVDPGHVGGASGATNTARMLGLLLGVALFGTVASSAFETSFQSNLGSAGVDGNTAKTIAEGDASQRAGGGAGFEPLRGEMPPGTAPELLDGVVRAARQSFVDGLHTGLLLSIGFMLLAALISLIFVRSHVISLFRVHAEPLASQRGEPDSVEEKALEPAPAVTDPSPTPQEAVLPEPVAQTAAPQPDEKSSEDTEEAAESDSAAEAVTTAESAAGAPADFSTILFQFPFKAGTDTVIKNITGFLRSTSAFHDQPLGAAAPRVPFPEPIASRMGATTTPDIATLAGYLLLEQRFGRINPDTRPELAATALIGAARSMKLWSFSDTATQPDDDFLEGMVGVVMEGIGPVAGPGPAPVGDASDAETPLSA